MEQPKEELKDLSSFLSKTQTFSFEDKKEPSNFKIPNDLEENTCNEDESIEEVLSSLKPLRIRLGVVLVMFITSLYLSLCNLYELPMPSIIFPENNMTLYLIVVLSTLVISMAFSMPVVFNGIKNLFSGKPNYDTPVAVCSFVVFTHTIYITLTKSLVILDGDFYCSVAILAILFNTMGKILMVRRIATGMKLCEEKNLYAEVITSENPLIDKLMDGQGFDFPSSSHNAKVKKINNVVDIGFSPDFSEDINKISFPVLCALGLILALITTFVLKESLLYGVDFFCAMVCVATALTETLVSNMPLFKANKALVGDGAFIGGYKVIEEFENVNAIVINANELYPEGSLKLHGMKVFGEKAANDIVIDACSLMNTSDGLMKNVLLGIIENKTELLKSVSGIEIKNAGTKGYLGMIPIAMGSCEFMKNEGISIPNEALDFESNYQHSGKSLMYLAEDNVVSAIFVVSYRPGRKIAQHMRNFAKRDFSIILNSSDPNVNAEKVAQDYDYNQKFICQVSDEDRINFIALTSEADSAEAFLVEADNCKNRLRMINMLDLLRRRIHAGVYLQVIGMVLEMLISIVCIYIDFSTAISFVEIIICKLIISFIALIPAIFFKE